jgi:dihydrofolate reductase
MLMMSVSLDGFVARPDHDLSWIFPQFDDATLRWIISAVSRTDTQLLGRVNYLEQAAHWPASTEEIAPLINGADKIVFSRTLERVEWKNSRLATAEPAEEIARLKRLPGKDIFVPGGATFARSLIHQRLVDLYRLIVHPVALGDGLPLFTERVDLRLVDSTAFPSGAVALTYEPAAR